MTTRRLVTIVASLHLVALSAVFILSGCQSGSTNYGRSRVVDKDRSNSYATPVAMNDDEAMPAMRMAPTRPSWDMNGQESMAKMDESVLEPIAATTPTVASGSTYTVKKGDSLWVISQRMGTSVSALASANGLPKDAQLKIGQKIIIPDGGQSVSGNVAAEAVAPVCVGQPTQAYTVRSGDSLSKIAKQAGTTVAMLKSINGLSSDSIRIGQKLKVPAGGVIASSASSSANASHTVAAAAPLVDATEYTVRPGDSLSVIASRTGTRVKDLMAWNDIEDARMLRAGQVLRLPRGSDVASSSTKATNTTESTMVIAVEVEDANAIPLGFGDDSLLDSAEATAVVPVDADVTVVSSTEMFE